MTKPGRTVIAVLLDRSRSARATRTDVHDGLTALLAEQHARPGDVLVSIAAVGDRPERLPAPLPIAEVTVPRVRPRGAAALRDGLGTLVGDLGTSLAAMPEDERPSRVLVLVVSSGPDTAGTGDPQALADLVGSQERDYAWEFVFVGSDATAVETAAALGIAPGRVLACAPTPDGVRSALGAASAYLSRARESGPWAPVEGFSDAERSAAGTPSDAGVTEPSGWWTRVRRTLAGRRRELSTTGS